MRAIFSFFVMALVCSNALAAAKPVAFQVVPEKSSIRFETSYEGKAKQGAFSAFTAEILFHPEALAESKASAEIDLTKVKADDQEVVSTLETESWFSSAKFPKATFVSSSFKSLGDKRYQVDGTLTIKAISVPISLVFTLEKFDAKAAVIEGEATLKRLSFKLGWEDTKAIPDDVRVKIHLEAVSK